MAEFQYILYLITGTLTTYWELMLTFLPILLLVEVPLLLLIFIGILHWSWGANEVRKHAHPSISFIVTCYAEGKEIEKTIVTLVEQIYPNHIEILVVIDGAKENKETYKTAISLIKKYKNIPNKTIKILPKWQRGGRVSTLNAGLSEAKHELVINVDGDTSFDNNMALKMARTFANPNVIACGGALRVRNRESSFWTKMQSLEYMMSMQSSKTGMATWGLLNNISGAFGGFRRSVLKQVGGWNTHTAEDLDLTIRLKQYKKRYPGTRLNFSPRAIGHTDVPDTFKGLMSQRLRWDGDLLFVYLRKHKHGLRPKLYGWGSFGYTLVYGVLQAVLLPILMTLFNFYIFIFYPTSVVLAVLSCLYVIYLVFIATTFLIYLSLISERIQEDREMLLWLLIYPFYALFMRFVTAFAMINEIVRRSHEESSMAPWWVLKRGKRF
ncbi:glycosyltransferase family 2 protein [Aliivibrio fischeri]|uniref:glycosyltransferase family 2 protein n=1 Tax=Aliivibrio fischeri TaxID=668 RepID=UPI0012DAAE4B|nr:glycosyltransferase [Aliivibrio fischeri]MUK68847.1 glycosyltransferase [Aliivibrio fischeri]MUK73456.1 glycosyltransferase [Aliivibrio fischeri]